MYSYSNNKDPQVPRTCNSYDTPVGPII